MKTMHNCYLLGYIYGLLMRAAAAHGKDQELSPTKAAKYPLREFAKAQQVLYRHHIVTPHLTERIMEVAAEIDEIDEKDQLMPPEYQSSWYLGYYHAKADRPPYICSAKGLRNCRKALDMTQEEAAEKVGCTQKQISAWECGDTLPTITYLKRLADVYQCKVDDLI